jgi:hypothetical protein
MRSTRRWPVVTGKVVSCAGVPVSGTAAVGSLANDVTLACEVTAYSRPAPGAPAGTTMPLSASMATLIPVTRCGRLRYGNQGACASGPSSMRYCCTTPIPAVRRLGSVSAGTTPPEGRNVRWNVHPAPSYSSRSASSK